MTIDPSSTNRPNPSIMPNIQPAIANSNFWRNNGNTTQSCGVSVPNFAFSNISLEAISIEEFIAGSSFIKTIWHWCTDRNLIILNYTKQREYCAKQILLKNLFVIQWARQHQLICYFGR